MKLNSINKKVSRITQDTLTVGIDVAKRTYCIRMMDFREVDLIKHLIMP
ncbi:hypothetical protein [Thermosipho melanesiensis]|nr:hypothetical protein [Thermosipho melanesiensis]